MEACAASRLRFVVCDRPNPIGGAVEGAPQSTGYLTFVGLHPIPVRHGMTAGELARLFAAERRLDLDLVVCSGHGLGARHALRRDRASLDSALARTCRRRTRRSSTRGCACWKAPTSRRGAARRGRSRSSARPGSTASALAEALNALVLPGVSFLPLRFRPMFDKHAGTSCGGALLAGDRPLSPSGRFRPACASSRPRAGSRRSSSAGERSPTSSTTGPAVDLLTGSPSFRADGRRRRQPPGRDRPPLRRGPGFPGAARAVSPLPGPAARGRRVRGRPRLGEDEHHRGAGAAAEGPGPHGRNDQALDPRRGGRRGGQGFAAARRRPGPRWRRW